MFVNSERRRLQEEHRKNGRLPPGQSLTLKWPVLHVGPVPEFDPATWKFSVGGRVRRPFELDWEQFQALPRVQVQADFHCVTTWSKFDNIWEGVSLRTIIDRAAPLEDASHVIQHCDGGYTTNTPLEDLLRDDVVLADTHSPEPLTPAHGGPLRMIIPHLYAWKSSKWIRGLEFAGRDRAGYWEERGYHMYGDPFREQRFG